MANSRRFCGWGATLLSENPLLSPKNLACDHLIIENKVVYRCKGCWSPVRGKREVFLNILIFLWSIGAAFVVVGHFVVWKTPHEPAQCNSCSTNPLPSDQIVIFL